MAAHHPPPLSDYARLLRSLSADASPAFPHQPYLLPPDMPTTTTTTTTAHDPPPHSSTTTSSHYKQRDSGFAPSSAASASGRSSLYSLSPSSSSFHSAYSDRSIQEYEEDPLDQQDEDEDDEEDEEDDDDNAWYTPPPANWKHKSSTGRRPSTLSVTVDDLLRELELGEKALQTPLIPRRKLSSPPRTSSLLTQTIEENPFPSPPQSSTPPLLSNPSSPPPSSASPQPQSSASRLPGLRIPSSQPMNYAPRNGNNTTHSNNMPPLTAPLHSRDSYASSSLHSPPTPVAGTSMSHSYSSSSSTSASFAPQSGFPFPSQSSPPAQSAAGAPRGADPAASRAGYIQKQSSAVFGTSWKKRYLVLDRGSLFLFRSHKSPQKDLTSLFKIGKDTSARVSEHGMWVIEILGCEELLPGAAAAAAASTSAGAPGSPAAAAAAAAEAAAFMACAQSVAMGGVPISASSRPPAPPAKKMWILKCADKDDMVAWLTAIRAAIKEATDIQRRS
ncbi:hypothetical protein HDU87_001704 [Geranomyces variabilis]|uniref:PH domain-containing protein n=1 Tax=Geranomyces variabilis TaxID=109894 RepID=A0AAD5TDB2_9FUNG|nr:hypothetical protein HDU87_001704 [Geranomyces variabilis]